MRTLPPRSVPLALGALLALAACDRAGVRIEGTLAPDRDPDAPRDVVAVAADAEPRIVTPIRRRRFAVRVPPGRTALELRFLAADSAPRGRLRLAQLPPTGALRLDAIWIREGWAFPERVSAPRPVAVNGLRLGGRAPDRLAGRAVVLIADSTGVAWVRPLASDGPDLAVRPAADSQPKPSPGDTVDLWAHRAGDWYVLDSLRVRASTGESARRVDSGTAANGAAPGSTVRAAATDGPPVAPRRHGPKKGKGKPKRH